MYLHYVYASAVSFMFFFFFSSRRRHTRCALVTGVQTCALPISACASSARIRGFPPHRASRMQTRHLLFCLLAGTALAACNREPTPADAASTTAPEAAATVPAYAFSDDITTGDFTELVKPLASDEFEGRGPGTPGGEKTVEYIKAQFGRIGLHPGNDASWFQALPRPQTTAHQTTTPTTHVA